MGSSDLISEKFAMYFATMNPLASKIYSDIEGIEDYLKSHGPPSMTYNEKCSIVDKFLIHDHLNKNDSHGKLSKRLSEYQRYHLHKSEMSLNSFLDNEKDTSLISETELLQPVFYNDSTLDQDHETVLLTSVAPKKPEKYVYDDSNYWIDEHSGTYSCCTETQAKACNLRQFLDSLPPPPQVNKKHENPHKYRAPPIPTLSPKNDNDAYITKPKKNDEDSYIIKPKKSDEEKDRYSKIDKMDRENKNAQGKGKYSVAVPVFGGLFGDAPAPQKKTSGGNKAQESECNDPEDLPNQVKNNDLIAELQAKLKKGKTQTSDGISPRSSLKMNKPKAPPPPPPGNVKPPGGAVKVLSEKSFKKSSKESHFRGNESVGNGNYSDKAKMEKDISDDDFVVDVSSPCKIATPKTGLDFLDNW